MFIRSSRLAVLLAALSLSAGALAAAPERLADCKPEYDTPASEVLRTCGEPKARYYARWTNSDTVQSEWDYGRTIVGLIDGRVAYVLDLSN